MSEIHALSGAYATHGLDDLERVRFERHLRDCPACLDEVDGLREAASLLAETTVAPPPTGLRSRVLTDISTVRPLAPIVETTVEPAPSRRPGRLFRGLAAAAAAVVLAGTGAAVWHPWSDERNAPSSNVVSISQVIDAPDAKHYVKEFSDGATATLVRSPSLGRAVLTSNGLEPLPSDQVYEVWLKKGNDYLPAGTFDAQHHRVLLDGDAGHALGAAVTIEPFGGSDEPTSDAVAEFTFEQA